MSAVPIGDLAAVRVALGVVVVVVGLGVWAFGGGGGEDPPPEQSLPRAPNPVAAASPAVPATEFVVQAAGAVNQPGVVRVPDGARVADVVEAAGGLSKEADSGRLNLAARVMDGERVYVVRVGESTPPPVVGTGADSASGVEGGADNGQVNINTASEKTLEELPGVGPSTAKAIVDYREKSGPFKSVQDLSEVKGIGPAKLEQITPMARI